MTRAHCRKPLRRRKPKSYPRKPGGSTLADLGFSLTPADLDIPAHALTLALPDSDLLTFTE